METPITSFIDELKNLGSNNSWLQLIEDKETQGGANFKDVTGNARKTRKTRE